ncbi:uncharacterized protein BDW43DRAFT_53835 [Aspergillus alliaceus]|uniref:uncharacterized protein n=1 Tax=Petromyces alliaceus TaxID=209559 RepID=UPI0012A5001E|nr:uncharacterized protein BDW43DRAFT_53835 [Aspergillus alliaceus]KAB8234782.1 hypothetical protein BDW43DRAFT_53835 [Aspergillus alliaceus]
MALLMFRRQGHAGDGSRHSRMKSHEVTTRFSKVGSPKCLALVVASISSILGVNPSGGPLDSSFDRDRYWLGETKSLALGRSPKYRPPALSVGIVASGACGDPRNSDPDYSAWMKSENQSNRRFHWAEIDEVFFLLAH